MATQKTASRARRRRDRVFGHVAAVSGILFGGLLLAWAFAHWYGHDDQHMLGPSVGLTGIARIGIHDTGFGLIWLTNQDLPHMGGIITVSDGQGNVSPPTDAFGWDVPFYFRHIRQPGLTWWTAILPMPLLLLLTAIMPVIWLLRRRAQRRTMTRATSGRCGG